MRPIDVVRRFASKKAKAEYLAAFERGDALFKQHGITTPLRLTHFLAQVMHESGALAITEENLSYSAERMTQVWPGRFPTMAAAAPYAHNPRALANKTYNGRMGNRLGSDDGYTYRGRGLMQTTGRENYQRMGKLCGVDFEAQPELVVSAEHALKPALAEWTAGNLNVAADRDDIGTITRRINGGLIGIAERRAWLARLKPAVTSVTLDPAAPTPAPVPTPIPGPAQEHPGSLWSYLGQLLAAAIRKAIQK
jgi:putative chitinase